MKRREFIAMLGGAAGWPLAAHAQQTERPRRVAMLMGSADSDEERSYIVGFFARLEELGWKGDLNLRTDVRWWAGGAEQMQPVVADMLEASPDIVVAYTNFAVASLKPIAGNVPIVFVAVGDPIGSGFVASLAHPGGNVTGFTSNDAPMGGKWLELLKEAVTQVTRVLAIMHQETPIHQAFWRSIQDAAPHFGVDVTPGGVHDAAEIESAISSFAVKEDSGLIALPHALTAVNRDLIVSLSLRHRLPSIFGWARAADEGALVSYGVDNGSSFRQAAEYVDRILRGQKPGDLPVQQPVKFRLVLNLKTAKLIGLTIPQTFLARADEVIE